jgi:hypothetical protein
MLAILGGERGHPVSAPRNPRAVFFDIAVGVSAAHDGVLLVTRSILAP